jgi:hypothetical protein
MTAGAVEPILANRFLRAIVFPTATPSRAGLLAFPSALEPPLTGPRPPGKRSRKSKRFDFIPFAGSLGPCAFHYFFAAYRLLHTFLGGAALP